MTLTAELRGAGSVSEVVSPVVRWRAEVAGQDRDGTCDGIVVVDFNGAPLRITAKGRDLCGDTKRERVAWSELAARFNVPLGTIPPFTEAKVEILQLAVDTPVVFVGEVTERAIADDGGLREAPSARPSAVQATVIGIGDDADELVDRELAERARARTPTRAKRGGKQRRWHRRVLDRMLSMTATEVADVVVLAIVGALLLVAGNIARKGSADLRAPIGFACGVVALGLALRPAKQLEPFRAREHVHGRVVHLDAVWRCVAFGFGVFTLAMGLGIATGAVPTGPDGHRDGHVIIAAFGLLNTGLLLVGEIVAHPTVRRLATLAGRHSIEGVLRAKPVSMGNRKVALGRIEHWHTAWSDGPKGRTNSPRMKSAAFSTAPKLTLETDSGKLDIDPQEVAWLSTIKVRHETGDGWEIIRSIPVDGRAVVHGTRDGTRLRSHGLSPVLLLAGPASPRAWAASAVRWRYFVRAILIASTAGLVWSSGWLV